MPRKLSEAEVNSARECFAIFGRQHKLPRENLGKALRSLGANPSNKDLSEIIASLRLPEMITFEEFKMALSSDYSAPDTAEEIREAFGVFDRDGEGSVAVSELRHVLLSMGEKLTGEEVDLILKEANVDEDGKIRYEQFVEIMKRE